MESNFGKLINELRTKKGLTQKELADELHISDKTISRWETGNNLPDFDMLTVISKFFKVPLNDLVIARAANGSKDDKIVQDIVKEFTRMDHKKSRIIKIVAIISFVIVLFLIGAFIFSNSYNRFKVYKVSIDSTDFYSVEGTYVETKIKDSMYLNNIVIRNYKPNIDDTITVDLYYVENDKEYIIQSYSRLEHLTFDTYESYIKIDDLSKYKDDLYIRVKVLDSKDKVSEYGGKILFGLDFSNNKIYTKDNNLYFYDRKCKFTSEEIIDILTNNGYYELNNDNLVFVSSNNKLKSHFYAYSNILYISLEKDNLIYKYNYHIDYSILDVTIFDKNNTEIENYKYDVLNKKVIECKTGSCNDYNEAMKVIDKYFLDFLK